MFNISGTSKSEPLCIPNHDPHTPPEYLRAKLLPLF